MSRPLVVTTSSALLDDLLRLAAVAGIEVEVAPDGAAARRAWAAAPLVLVGHDLIDAMTAAGLPRRPDVVVVSTDLDDASVWRRAVEVGADHVAFLPDGEAWVLDRLAETVSPGNAGRLVTVLGGRGGAGATSLAVALAITGNRIGWRTLLVDGDPLAGGIDLVLGGESQRGPRWPEVLGADRSPGPTLTDALPRMHELSVLSWGRDDTATIPPDAMAALLATGRRGSDLVVVDLPRCFDEAACAALGQSTTTLIVVPAEIRAVAAATRVATQAARYAKDLRIVVREPAPSGLSGRDVAASIGLPLAGWLKEEKGLDVALENGDPPAAGGRGHLAGFARQLLTELLGPVPSGVSRR